MLETSRPAACKLRQLSVSVAQQGLRATLYWAVYGYLRPNRFIVLRWKRSSAAALPIPGVSYATWDAAEMRRRRQNRSALPPAFFQDQIDGVRRCVVAVVDDEVVGCIWIYGPGDISRLFDLEPYDVELNHGCVLPSCRARGIFSSMLFFGATQLAAEGHRRVYAGVHAQNTASMKAFTRAGFDVIGTVRHVGPYRPKYRLRHGLIGKVLVDPMGVPIGRICDVRTRWQRDERVVTECTVGASQAMSAIARLFGFEAIKHTFAAERLDLSDPDYPYVVWPDISRVSTPPTIPHDSYGDEGHARVLS